MSKVTSPVTRILRVHCANAGCPNVYDYTGPKSANFAVIEAQAFGWGQHITGQMQCSTHAGGTLVTSVEMEAR